MKPKVSVIIPNYNHSPYLKQRIDSVLNQTYQDFEVIILDDCSTDNSKEIIEGYRNHAKISQIIYNEINSGGPYKQWKKGIELANAEIIWIAESDDFADVDFLKELIPCLEDNSIGIAYCNSHWINDKNEIKESLSINFKDFKRNGIEEINKFLINYNTIQNVSSVIFRKVLAVPYLNNMQKFKSCGDWYLYISILQNSNLFYGSRKLNYFRWYHHNTSNHAFENDLWVFEHTLILRLLDYKKITVNKNQLNIAILKKVIKSQKLSAKNKLQSIINIVVSYKKMSIKT